ncbi:MAG: N-acetylneuraminate synthase family protein [Verrucomicrobia bacterium]|nr:N-acetylneuraminate synthase family protein [Verrucomicrobiota bacterium]
MIIGNRDLRKQRLLIAEIGNNHEGDARLALEMVGAAAAAGADAVKVQVINPERLVNRSQKERIAQLSRFRLPRSVFVEMAGLAKEKGILFIASAFDFESLDSVAELVDSVKIASGDLDFGPLLTRAAQINKPIILSTGMATLDEVGLALDLISASLPKRQALAESVALLHCVSLYPTPAREANLRAIETLRSACGLTVGFSDHTIGIEVALMALALGARIVEKHFTLDKSRTTFRDHALSADPHDLRRLATLLHDCDEILGTGEKAPSVAEKEASTAARRSVVAARDLPAGTKLTLDDIDYLRPRNGLSPLEASRMAGRIVATPLKAHEVLLEQHLV